MLKKAFTKVGSQSKHRPLVRVLTRMLKTGASMSTMKIPRTKSHLPTGLLPSKRVSFVRKNRLVTRAGLKHSHRSIALQKTALRKFQSQQRTKRASAFFSQIKPRGHVPSVKSSDFFMPNQLFHGQQSRNFARSGSDWYTKSRTKAMQVKAKERQLKEIQKERLKKQKEKEKTRKVAEQTKEKKLKEKEKKQAIKANRVPRARSAFTFFIAEHYAKERSSMSESTQPREVITQLGAKWKSLSPQQKQPFLAKAETDKKRSETERAQKKAEKPKRPLSPYLKFCAASRPQIMKENPQMKITEIAKILGQRWKALSESQKESFSK